MANSIATYELTQNNAEVNFAIRSIPEVMQMFGDNTDKPHTHNYYTVLWAYNAAGKHIIDYKEFDIMPDDIFFSMKLPSFIWMVPKYSLVTFYHAI